jgi:hypothetical protein
LALRAVFSALTVFENRPFHENSSQIPPSHSYRSPRVFPAISLWVAGGSAAVAFQLGIKAQTLIASVTATFVAHLFLGEAPAFVIPPIQHFSWILILLVPPAAALAALAGVAFQKGTLIWRDKIKNIRLCPTETHS